MDKQQLIEKINSLEGLSSDEKSALLALLREQKKYGLVWEDKPEDVEQELLEKLPVLTEVKERAIISDDPSAPNHILIEGDNLHALTALSYTHEGKIDVIYIDPPYNTGKSDEFKYNDKYVDNQDCYRHSKWLSFISKRLRIAKRLLKENGVIFISVDDNEIAQLKCVCDEIFNTSSDNSNSNCLGVLIWDLGTGTQAGHFTRAHEYILTYTNNKDLVPNFSGGEGEIDHSALKKISRKNPAVKYLFKAGTIFKATDGTELFGEWGGSERTTLLSGRMAAENGKLKYDVELEAGFAMIKQMKSWFNGEYTIDSKGQHVIGFYFNKSGVLHYTKERSVINPPSVLKDFGSTKTGSTELSTIMCQDDTFGYPKPTELITFLLQLQSCKSTILDFFAGSGTTLHATMALNAEDGGHRKCILVTNNENQICEKVTYERNKRVINGYTKPNGEAVEGLHDNTLRYYRTDSVPRQATMSNMRALVSASTDLLCIKNDIYTELPSINGKKLKPQVARLFENGDRKMLVVYVEEAIPFMVEEIKKMDVKEKIKVYLFSPSAYPFTDEFQEVADKVETCALPSAIYQAYKKVLPKRKPKFDSAIEEPVKEEEL